MAGKQAPAKPEKDAKDSSGKTVAKATSVHQGKRDPFVSPIVERPAGVRCTGTGRQCLFVGAVELQGVGEDSSGFIAVVASGVHTYFLRDKDPLADGQVVRITRDSIVMLQRTSDAVGRPVEREVIRKIGRPAA